MSALQQFPGHLVQTPVPLPSQAPPEGTWTEKQPIYLREPPSSTDVFDQDIVRRRRPIHRREQDLDWQRLIREVLPESATNGLEAVYVIRDRPALASFIKENRLRGILLEAREPLNAVFGEAAIKTLSLLRDDEGFDILFCLVMVPGDMQEARRALRSFDQRWWLSSAKRAGGKLNFDFELV